MYRNYPSITDINDVATLFMLEPIMMSLCMVRNSGSGGSFGLMEEMADMWNQVGREELEQEYQGGGGGGGRKTKKRKSSIGGHGVPPVNSPTEVVKGFTSNNSTKKRRRLDYNEEEEGEDGEEGTGTKGTGGRKRKLNEAHHVVTSSSRQRRDRVRVLDPMYSSSSSSSSSLTPLDPNIHITNLQTLNPSTRERLSLFLKNVRASMSTAATVQHSTHYLELGVAMLLLVATYEIPISERELNQFEPLFQEAISTLEHELPMEGGGLVAKKKKKKKKKDDRQDRQDEDIGKHGYGWLVGGWLVAGVVC